MSKTKEVEVWYSEYWGRIYKDGESMPLDVIKAKLIIPVEPEVLHLDYDFTISGSDERNVNWLPLLGKRWHIVATEVVE